MWKRKTCATISRQWKKRSTRRKLSWTSICSLFEKRDFWEGSKAPRPTVDQGTWLGRSRSVITDQTLGDEKFLTCWKDILIATASPSIDILFCIKTHWGHLSQFWKLFDWLYLIYVVLWTCADKGLSEYVDDKLKEISTLLCKFLRQAANTHFLGSLIKRRGVGARGGKTEPKLGQSL